MGLWLVLAIGVGDVPWKKMTRYCGKCFAHISGARVAANGISGALSDTFLERRKLPGCPLLSFVSFVLRCTRNLPILSSRDGWKLNPYPHAADAHHEHDHSDLINIACNTRTKRQRPTLFVKDVA